MLLDYDVGDILRIASGGRKPSCIEEHFDLFPFYWTLLEMPDRTTAFDKAKHTVRINLTGLVNGEDLIHRVIGVIYGNCSCGTDCDAVHAFETVTDIFRFPFPYFKGFIQTVPDTGTAAGTFFFIYDNHGTRIIQSSMMTGFPFLPVVFRVISVHIWFTFSGVEDLLLYF